MVHKQIFGNVSHSAAFTSSPIILELRFMELGLIKVSSLTLLFPLLPLQAPLFS